VNLLAVAADASDVVSNWTSQAGGGSFFWYVIFVIGFWPTLVKAGRPGWGAIIPIYNLYLMLKIAGRPGWWLILYIIPIVNIIIAIIVALDLARAFGKSTLFGVIGLWLFQPIGLLIVGFGEARYQGVPRH